jgi:type I restriction enzyme S subunit
MKFERLGDKIKQVRGISYKPNDISEISLEDYLPILKANNIQENGLETSSLIYIHKSKIKEEQLIRKGDLLLAASSGSKDIVGKSVFFENDFNGSFGAFCKVVRPNKNIYPKFLSVFFKTPIYKRHIRNLIQGANINNLRSEDINSLKIPIFSQQGQIHIANLLSKAEDLIKQRKESIRLLDEFLKSIFLVMFGDPVTNEKEWEKDKVITFADCIVPGRDKPKSFTGEIPWLTTEDLVQKGFVFKSGKGLGLSEIEINQVKAKIIPKGSVIMTCVGDLGVISINKIDCIVNQQLHTFQCKPEMNNIFLMYSLSFQTKFMYKTASTTTVPYMNKTICNSIPVINPPFFLQTQFSQIVEKTEALKAQYQSSLLELESLYGSLSQRAFKGELDLSMQSENLRLAAEPESVYQTHLKSSIPDNKKGFAKQVLGGKIVSLFKNDKNFTHIKFQKLQYLAEHIIEEDLLWNYYRQAAGPYDNKFMHNVALKLEQNKWFEERKYKFYPLQKANEIEKHYQNYFGSKNEKLNNLFSLLNNGTEKFCEAVATIYAVWNNHIIQQQSFDKEKIKKDFFDWSNRKEQVFSENEFEMAMQWMQKHEIVPTGFGYLIKEGSKKKMNNKLTQK